MSAVFLGLEMVILVGDVVRGTTSHFNVSTPLDATLWMVMAGAIAAVWVATLMVSAILFRNPGPDRARNLAIRAGAVIAVIGMALGFLMTIPQPAQLVAGGKILGAHTVGSPTAVRACPCSAGAPWAGTCASRTSLGCTRCS